MIFILCKFFMHVKIVPFKIVPLKCFMKLFVLIAVNNTASNLQSLLTWVDIVPPILKAL